MKRIFYFLDWLFCLGIKHRKECNKIVNLQEEYRKALFKKERDALTDADWKHPDMVLGLREYLWLKKHKCRTGDAREFCDNNEYREHLWMKPKRNFRK